MQKPTLLQPTKGTIEPAMQASIEDLIESATPVYEEMRSGQSMSSRPRIVDEFIVDDCCMSQVRMDLPSLLFVWVGVLCLNVAGLYCVYAAARWAWSHI